MPKILTDEELEHHAANFLEQSLATLLGITFEQYLQDIEGHNQIALYLIEGGSLCTYLQTSRPVGKPTRKPAFTRLQKAI